MTIITPSCCVCGKTTAVDVDTDRYMKWLRGMLIQSAFPEMGDDDRELLLSGTHAKCWEDLNAEA
jgi:hypothetical protein